MLATYADAIREYAHNAGCENPDTQWILTPFDTWERNPFYSGPEQPHPEDDRYEFICSDNHNPENDVWEDIPF